MLIFAIYLCDGFGNGANHHLRLAAITYRSGSNPEHPHSVGSRCCRVAATGLLLNEQKDKDTHCRVEIKQNGGIFALDLQPEGPH